MEKRGEEMMLYLKGFTVEEKIEEGCLFEAAE